MSCTSTRIFRHEALTMLKIFEVIRRSGPIAQVEISRRLNITRTAVNTYVQKLVKEGVVYSASQCRVGVGRPQTLLDIHRDENGAIGFSVDYPYVHVGISNFAEEIIASQCTDVSAVTTREDLEQYIVAAARAMKAAAAREKVTLHSTCFATAGALDGVTGKVTKAVNFPATQDLDAQGLLSPLLRTPVYVVPSTVATYWGGLTDEDEDCRVFHVIWDIGVGTILGTGTDIRLSNFQRDPDGIGRGLRDMGHVIYKPGGRKCHCGEHGCLEAYFGGWAMIRDLQEAEGGKNSLSFLDFLARAKANDAHVRDLIVSRGRELGSVLGWIFTAHKPCRIKLSGRVADVGSWVFDAFCDGIRQRLGTQDLDKIFAPAWVTPTNELQLSGACRLATHVRFNLPLLPIVRMAEDVDELTDAVVQMP